MPSARKPRPSAIVLGICFEVIPIVVRSLLSTIRISSLSSNSVDIRPSSRVRSPVITTRMPDRRALLHDLLPGLDEAAAVQGVVRREEALPAVEEDHDVRHPFGALGVPPLLGDVGEPGHGQRLLPLGDQLAEPGDQPVHPVGLVAAHDGADVGEADQREQGVVAAVDAVDVHVGGAGPPADRTRQRPQHRRAPGAGGGDDAEVAALLEVVGGHVAPLLGGYVDQAERQHQPVGGGRGRRVLLDEVVEGDHLGEGLQPGLAHRRQPELVTGLGDRGDERGQVGGDADVVVRADGDRPAPERRRGPRSRGRRR